MLGPWLRFGLWGTFVAVIGITLINAFYMLISPKAWFELPAWLRLQGVLTADQYRSGWGAKKLRVLGAVFVATAAWVSGDLIIDHWNEISGVLK